MSSLDNLGLVHGNCKIHDLASSQTTGVGGKAGTGWEAGEAGRKEGDGAAWTGDWLLIITLIIISIAGIKYIMTLLKRTFT